MPVGCSSRARAASLHAGAGLQLRRHRGVAAQEWCQWTLSLGIVRRAHRLRISPLHLQWSNDGGQQPRRVPGHRCRFAMVCFGSKPRTGRCVPYGEETTVLSCEASHLQGLAAVLPFVMRLPLVCCGSHLRLPWSAWSRMSILQSLHKWMRTAKITGVS